MNKNGYLLPAATLMMLAILSCAVLVHRIAIGAYETALFRYNAEQSHCAMHTILHVGCLCAQQPASPVSMPVQAIPCLKLRGGSILLKRKGDASTRVNVTTQTPLGIRHGWAEVVHNRRTDSDGSTIITHEIIRWHTSSK